MTYFLFKIKYVKAEDTYNKAKLLFNATCGCIKIMVGLVEFENNICYYLLKQRFINKKE